MQAYNTTKGVLESFDMGSLEASDAEAWLFLRAAAATNLPGREVCGGPKLLFLPRGKKGPLSWRRPSVVRFCAAAGNQGLRVPGAMRHPAETDREIFRFQSNGAFSDELAPSHQTAEDDLSRAQSATSGGPASHEFETSRPLNTSRKQ